MIFHLKIQDLRIFLHIQVTSRLSLQRITNSLKSIFVEYMDTLQMPEEAILKPEGGFATLSGFQLAVKEHCAIAKEPKVVSCSRSKLTKVAKARLQNDMELGVNDRNMVRFVFLQLDSF